MIIFGWLRFWVVLINTFYYDPQVKSVVRILVTSWFSLSLNFLVIWLLVIPQYLGRTLILTSHCLRYNVHIVKYSIFVYFHVFWQMHTPTQPLPRQARDRMPQKAPPLPHQRYPHSLLERNCSPRINFACLWSLNKWNNTVCVPLHLLISLNVFEIHVTKF